MKVVLALAAMLAVAKAQLPTPSQTFFIPMPEKDTFDNTFKTINSGASKPVTSMISFAISTDDTVIWYDHWEDGYDASYASGLTSSTTEIWGDGDCSNGYASGTSCSRGSDDVLVAGQSIVIQDSVPATSQRYDGNGNPYYDGRDKVLASFPIAITRGMYPSSPGSLMAGAVEVMDTGTWGTTYMCPVGINLSQLGDTSSERSRLNAFEHVAWYIMASEDDTTVTFYNRFGSQTSSITLNAGESYDGSVGHMGEKIVASSPVQVELITGDTGSNYELRWFSLLPRENWSTAYLTPVGDSVGQTRALLFNPHDTSLTVYRELESGNSGSYSVGAKDVVYTQYTPTGTGAEFTANRDFIALSLTDTLYSSTSTGQIFDWGFPIMPTNRLSVQALVGWGFGCTSNNCGSGDSRSVVWVSPVADADIYIDTDNNGSWNIRRQGVSRLESEVFTDSDDDLSGAVIWATAPGAGASSNNLVEIAVAWGQDPNRSYSGDGRALDLGTVVPPMPVLRAIETCALNIDNDGDGRISPGDIVRYTIQVQNVGQRDYAAGEYRFVQPCIAGNLPRQTLVPGSGRYLSGSSQTPVSDNALRSSSGYPSGSNLPKRGGVQYLVFDAVVGPPPVLDVPIAYNQATITQPGLGPNLPVSASEPVYLDPVIEIEKTVWLGDKPTCSDGSDLVYGPEGNLVTYCFKVTNAGNTYLNNVEVVDGDISMSPQSIPLMAPGDEVFVKFNDNIPDGGITSTATASGDPVLVNSNPIPTYSGGPVSDTDPAGVAEEEITTTPDIEVKKTVHLGPLATCFNGDELQYGFDGTLVTYCFEVLNTGDDDLTSVRVTDNSLGYSQNIGNLAAGASSFAPPKPSSITSTTSSNARAVGTPVLAGGTVEDTDPAGVVLLPPRAPCV